MRIIKAVLVGFVAIFSADLAWQLACKKQTKPDGKNCALCGDIDHQAFECRFNSLSKRGREFWTELRKLE